jgi:hypothetical protein
MPSSPRPCNTRASSRTSTSPSCWAADRSGEALIPVKSCSA